MKTLSPTQQACLDAMGIDVWVPRNEDVIEVVPQITAESSNIKSSNAESINSENQNLENQNLKSIEKNSQIESNVDYAPVAESVTPTTIPKIQKNETVIAPITIPSDWNGLRQAVSNCNKCELHSSRTQTVFGEGNQKANWLIIGDTPTEEDDKSGNPFTGQSGELLTAMLRAIKLTRQQVFITNTLKCTTPKNREPEAIEIDACLQHLHQQIKFIQPKLILVMGQSAAQRLLNNQSTLARLREKVHTLEGTSIPVVVTYHPSSLLSMPTNKGKAWQDLQLAQKTILTDTVL